MECHASLQRPPDPTLQFPFLGRPYTVVETSSFHPLPATETVHRPRHSHHSGPSRARRSPIACEPKGPECGLSSISLCGMTLWLPLG